VIGAFAYGVGVGLYRWPPFHTLKRAQDALIDSWTKRTLDDERALLRAAFTDPLIDTDLIHPPVTTLAGIREANASMLLPSDQFYDAYAQLQLVDAAPLAIDRGATRLLKVTYTLAGRRYDAYAYAVNTQDSARAAALVIPGTGLNQSSAIHRNEGANYQSGVTAALGSSVATFVLIKPNEDCLAFHDGRRKLNQGFFINWLLNAGGSYSAHYIANSLAITKYLQRKYRAVAVIGLSQGGYAALLNSIQSRPDVAVIASGFSVGTRDMPARHDQIIIPGLQSRLGDGAIRSRMQEIATRFLFTYGRDEVGRYGIEATEQPTCEYFSELPNVECRIHEDGHAFPADILREFLRRELGL
jgi:hypothetical protein